MRDNPEGGELNPAEDVRRRCKCKNSFVLSCIGKRAREDCDRGSEVGTVYNGRDHEGPVPLRNRRNVAEERVVKKVNVSKKSSCLGLAGWKHG